MFSQLYAGCAPRAFRLICCTYIYESLTSVFEDTSSQTVQLLHSPQYNTTPSGDIPLCWASVSAHLQDLSINFRHPRFDVLVFWPRWYLEILLRHEVCPRW